MSTNGKRLMKDMVFGAIGGVIGTVVMEQVTGLMYRFESDEKKKKEEKLRTSNGTAFKQRRSPFESFREGVVNAGECRPLGLRYDMGSALWCAA